MKICDKCKINITNQVLHGGTPRNLDLCFGCSIELSKLIKKWLNKKEEKLK